MDKPFAYAVVKEIKYCPYPETYVASIVTSERGAWEELSKELNNILNNVYANVKFIPHQTMPCYIGVEYIEYLPYPVHVKYTIHKKQVTRKGYYG